MPKRHKRRRKIVQWHKRIGLISAFFVVLLSLTGILLNHTTTFKLDRHFISSDWLLDAYGVIPPNVASFSMGERWVSEVSGAVYFDDQYITECRGAIVGALSLEAFWLLACEQQLVLITHEQEVIEKIPLGDEFPGPAKRLGLCQQQICLSTPTERYILDLNEMTWREKGRDGSAIMWSKAGAPPEPISKALSGLARGNIISWEKVVLDIHAGRFLGPLGPLFMDFIAILFIFIAGSGVYMWQVKGGKKKR